MAAFCPDRIGHGSMFPDLIPIRQFCREGFDAAFNVGGDATRDNEPDSAFGSSGKIGRQLIEASEVLLQAHVHGSHEYAIW